MHVLGLLQPCHLLQGLFFNLHCNIVFFTKTFARFEFFSDVKTGLIYFKSINLEIQTFGRPNLWSFLITFEPVNLASFSHNKLSTNPK